MIGNFIALIKACNSKNLLSLHMLLFGKYLRYQMLVFTDRGLDAAKEHQMIYEAALNRDADTATHYLKGTYPKRFDPYVRCHVKNDAAQILNQIVCL